MTSSPRPKSLAALFLLGAFLTGGAVGYAATRTFGGPMAAPAVLTQSQMQAQMRNRWKQELALTPEQIAKFDAFYDARKAFSDSIRALYKPAQDSIMARYRPALDSVRVHTQHDVMQILDASQQLTYQHMIEADKKRMDSAQKAGVMK